MKILVILVGVLLLLGLLFAIITTLSAAPAKPLPNEIISNNVIDSFKTYAARDVAKGVSGGYPPLTLPGNELHGLATDGYIFSIARSGTKCNFSVFGFPTLESYNAFIVANFWELDLVSDELRKGAFSVRNVLIYVSCNKDELSHEIITPVALALSAYGLSSS